MTEDDFARETHVSRETLAFYRLWGAQLRKWNSKINLVAPSTVDDFWRRHALDSWQVTQHIPASVRRTLDLGSGGGFPGLAVAEALKANKSAAQVTLIDSVQKKVSFLKTMIRDAKLPAQALAERVEDLPPQGADLITARAFAPLPRLFAYAIPHLADGGLLVLPKGEGALKDVDKARENWTFTLESVKSLSDPNASVLLIRDLAKLTK